jgi:hypothetical protein
MKKQTVSSAPKAGVTKHNGRGPEMFITPDNARSNKRPVVPTTHRAAEAISKKIEMRFEQSH